MPHCIVKEGSSSSWDYFTGKHTTVSLLTYMWIEVGKWHNGYSWQKYLKNTFIQQCSCAPRGHREHPWFLILCWECRRDSTVAGQEGHSSISCYPASRAAAKDSRESWSVLTPKEDPAPNCKTEILITKRNKSSKKNLLLKPWDKTKIRLVLHLLILTSFLCKDFWLVILNELLEDSHITQTGW